MLTLTLLDFHSFDAHLIFKIILKSKNLTVAYSLIFSFFFWKKVSRFKKFASFFSPVNLNSFSF